MWDLEVFFQNGVHAKGDEAIEVLLYHHFFFIAHANLRLWIL